MMNAKQYRQVACAAGATAADAKRQGTADGVKCAQGSQSRWLSWMVHTVKLVQATALHRADGRRVPGMFEKIANDTAKQFPLGAAAIRLIGFVGELCEDAVQATVDLWAAELIDQSTTGATDDSDRQVSFMLRGKALKGAKNWIGRLKGAGIITSVQAARANDYTESLHPVLFAQDVTESEFRGRLLARGLTVDFTEDRALVAHLENQYSLYLKELSSETRRERALGAVKFTAKADSEILDRIFAREEVFVGKAEAVPAVAPLALGAALGTI